MAAAGGARTAQLASESTPKGGLFASSPPVSEAKLVTQGGYAPGERVERLKLPAVLADAGTWLREPFARGITGWK